MEVILLERIGRLGVMGDVVKVKDGYGRNFLIPQKKALRASEANKTLFEARRAEIEKDNAARRAEAEKQAKKYTGLALKLVRQASEDGKLYGSVTQRDVVEAIEAQGQQVDRKLVKLDTVIKTTGTYTVRLVLHSEVEVPLSLQIVRNESELVQEAPPELTAPAEAEGDEVDAAEVFCRVSKEHPAEVFSAG